MILRKPYKFLIKYFRFIHFLLSIISVYFLLKTNSILRFFNNYLNSKNVLIGTGTNKEYFSGMMILLGAILIIGMLIILLLLKRKDKPILIYVINIAIYLFTYWIFIYSNSIMVNLETTILDIRVLKLVSDLVLLSFILQTFTTANLFIRTLGFDLKKFEFGNDSELEINEKDNEEFEFDINIDQNKIKRNLKKNIRNIKYTYFENKFLINTLFLVTITFSIGYYIINNKILNKIYKQNEIINGVDFSYSVIDSYITNKDYNNQVITDNYLVAVKIKAKSKYSDRKFETAKLQLTIDKQRYNVTKKYNNKINDLGNIYDENNIGNEYKEFVLIYEIPIYNVDKKMTLKYHDLNNKTYNIELKSKTFDKKLNDINANIKETLKFNDGVLKDTELKIDNYKIEDKIGIEYNYCVTKNDCYQSTEYLAPTLTGRSSKSLMELETEISDKTAELIVKYGYIEYKVEGAEKEIKEKITEVKPIKVNLKNKRYFEVNDDIYNSEYIKVVINIRNQKYQYVIK